MGHYEASPDETKKQLVIDRKASVTYYDNIVRNVVEQASYRRLSRTFSVARILMLAGAIVAAGGIALFAWAANPPSDTVVPVVVKTPSDVVVNFTDEGREDFGETLGSACDLAGPRPAVAIGEVGNRYELAMVPDDACTAAIITVAPSQATVTLTTEEADDPGSGSRD